jgi:hypothetical protein
VALAALTDCLLFMHPVEEINYMKDVLRIILFNSNF